MKSKIILLSLLLLVNCSSTKLVSTWKHTERKAFKAYKVLVVGMAQDEQLRTVFESSLVQHIKDQGIDALVTRFSDDYLEHQSLYYRRKSFKKFTVYHVVTSLYCICVDEDRELIWKGDIDVTQPEDQYKIIVAYIKRITAAMEQQVIF